MKKSIILLGLFLSINMFASANFVGISPSSAHLGELEPGTVREYTLHITSNSISRNFKVTPKYKGPKNPYENDNLDPEKVSEQDIKDWISFQNEETTIDPSTSYQTSLGGVTVKPKGNITMKISVPDDAEPGYHKGRIRPLPELQTSSGGYGATVQALQDFQFSFEVPGPVQRDFQIADMRAVRTDENEIRIDAYIRNTGTVTSRLEGGKAKVLDSYGDHIGDIDIPNTLVSKGDIETVSQTITSDSISGGDYQIDGQVKFRPTGMVPLEGVVNVPDQIQFVSPDEGAPEGVGDDGDGGIDLPLWLIMMGLTVLGVLMYSFEIDPSVILLFTAVLGVIFLIISTSISNLYLLIIAGGITVVYYLL